MSAATSKWLPLNLLLVIQERREKIQKKVEITYYYSSNNLVCLGCSRFAIGNVGIQHKTLLVAVFGKLFSKDFISLKVTLSSFKAAKISNDKKIKRNVAIFILRSSQLLAPKAEVHTHIRVSSQIL